MATTEQLKKMQEEKTMQLDTMKKNKTIWINGPTPAFDEHFTRLKQLGEAGQFGVTFQCRSHKNNQTYAVKLLNKNRFYRIPQNFRPQYLRAMHDEIDILSTLSHSNIVKLFNVYEDKSTLFIVMEECAGGELFQRIVDRGQYDEPAAAFVVKQLLSALQYMHEENNIVHCDLKPDNILFLDKSEQSPLKIIDFGMSKVLPRLQYLTHLCGTPYYTAPEIIRDKKFNHACDIWSVGVILFVMLYGYPPFYVDPQKYGKYERKAIYEKIKRGFVARVRSTEKHGFGPWFPDHIVVSQEVRQFIGKLLERNVKDRYTAKEALQHPWVVALGRTQDDPNAAPPQQLQNEQTKSLVKSLANFTNASFKLVVAKLFRAQFAKMRPQHFNQLETLFEAMDTDGDGVVSYEEFESAVVNVKDMNIEKKYIQQIFENVHADQKQKGIRFADLLNALVHDYLVACDERLYAAFRELDDDDDGKITTEQLKQKLKEDDPLGEWDKAIEIINAQTLDQNGVIDYEEFLLNLHPNFEETPDVFIKMKSLAPPASPEDEIDDQKDHNHHKKRKSKLKKKKSQPKKPI